MDEIEADQDLKKLFLASYYDSFQNQNNLEQMYSSDLLWWVLQIFDAKFTGEHNGAVNASKKDAKPKKMKSIESFKFLPGVAPIRWQNVLNDLRNKEVAKPKPKANPSYALEIIVMNARKGEEERKK